MIGDLILYIEDIIRYIEDIIRYIEDIIRYIEDKIRFIRFCYRDGKRKSRAARLARQQARKTE
jgi:hypothetical protein